MCDLSSLDTIDVDVKLLREPEVHCDCTAHKYRDGTLNQCDGCRAGMPVNEHNHHEYVKE